MSPQNDKDPDPGKKHLREEYWARVNRAIDFIEMNLDSDLCLDDISEIAGFSPFHFHRIFKALVGETLNSFVKRIRLERAAMILAGNPKTSVTDVAFECGFSSSQTFARAFREHFDVSPTEYRKNCNIGSKESEVQSKNRQDFHLSLSYSADGRPNLTYKLSAQMKMKVEVKDMPDMHVAYVRHIGPYQGDPELFKRLYGKLCAWAGPRELLNKDSKMMSVYHDDPKITEDAKQRVDVCLTVPEGTKVEGEIGEQTIPGGKYAIAEFEIKEPSEYAKAWEAVYKEWLPESGFQPDNNPPFELYEDKKDECEGAPHKVKICVPVKPCQG